MAAANTLSEMSVLNGFSERFLGVCFSSTANTSQSNHPLGRLWSSSHQVKVSAVQNNTVVAFREHRRERHWSSNSLGVLLVSY